MIIYYIFILYILHLFRATLYHLLFKSFFLLNIFIHISVQVLFYSLLILKRMDLVYYAKKVYAFARQYQRRFAIFNYVDSSDGDFFDGISLSISYYIFIGLSWASVRIIITLEFSFFFK